MEKIPVDLIGFSSVDSLQVIAYSAHQWQWEIRWQVRHLLSTQETDYLESGCSSFRGRSTRLGLNKPWSLWVVRSFAHRINKRISPVSSHMSSITLSNLHSIPMLATRYQSWQWEPMLLEQDVQLSISCDNHEVYMARASRTLDSHEVCTASELLQWAYFETSAACENSAYFPTRTDQKSNHLYFIRENPIEIVDTNQVINNQLTDDHNMDSAMLTLDSCEKAWVTLQPIQLCNVLEQWKGNHKTKCDAHHPKKVLPSGSFDKILLASVSTLFCKSLKEFNISSIWFFTERCQIS